ncbi:MAG: DSBA-like thioredoxin domain-containing protein [Candidatus Doudnabacteria bacterium Gr01-1014_77]|uniref:DSBA-like thioredoxin domain-containing protein n=1 Tax=Candidatus Doudnabacteria bacterium Gr01-1014_77 TaxID=2017133 RepID=A0A554JE45_9BACT|nr:MAG: DSBA-like thioredoxin domain-containing protein [Candidatus Doudnabacteria bacterium Gr01-1014_77]
MKKEIGVLLGVGLLIVILVGLGMFLAKSSGESVTASVNVLLDGAVYQTNYQGEGKTAKVNVVEFGDYQCPACSVAEPKVQELLAKYKDNKEFNFVFRSFPLPQHPNAMIASEAALAAGEQGKYFEMHSKLYTNQAEWENSPDPLDIYTKYATELGLNVNVFREAVRGEKFKDQILKDRSIAESIGVNATPTFFVNDKPFVGIPGDDMFQAVEEGLK